MGKEYRRGYNSVARFSARQRADPIRSGARLRYGNGQVPYVNYCTLRYYIHYKCTPIGTRALVRYASVQTGSHSQLPSAGASYATR